MRKVQNFNAGWVFSEGFDNAAINTLRDGESVRLPHTAVELPFNYLNEKLYQRAFTYQKVFASEPGFAGKRVSLVFDAAMADSVVFLNGKEIAAHKDGYTPFEVEIGPHLVRVMALETGVAQDGQDVIFVGDLILCLNLKSGQTEAGKRDRF